MIDSFSGEGECRTIRFAKSYESVIVTIGMRVDSSLGIDLVNMSTSKQLNVKQYTLNTFKLCSSRQLRLNYAHFNTKQAGRERTDIIINFLKKKEKKTTNNLERRTGEQGNGHNTHNINVLQL